MPPKRVVLGQIDQNIRRPCSDLSPFDRGEISGLHHGGASIRKISADLGIPKSTVADTLQQQPSRAKGLSHHRSGRKRSYSECDARDIICIIKKKPKISYDELKRESGTSLSTATLYRLIKRSGYMKWHCATRPAFTKQQARDRLKWCKAHRNYNWSNVIFSDECSVERGSGTKHEWAFRLGHQKWRKEMIIARNKGKDFNLMIWSAFWLHRETNLVVIERDSSSPRKGYSANSYIKVLDRELLGVYEGDMIFMQDNAPIYVAKKMLDWLDQHGIIMLDWPVYSLDLNPIENFWYRLKELLNEQYPELHDLSSTSDELRYEMGIALCQCWCDIDENHKCACAKSMKQWIEAVIKAKG